MQESSSSGGGKNPSKAIPARRMAKVRKSSRVGNIRLPSASHSVCARSWFSQQVTPPATTNRHTSKRNPIMKHSIQQLLSKPIQAAGMKHIFSLCS
jgi:hypothetical protein